jgi:hypothetical protein
MDRSRIRGNRGPPSGAINKLLCCVIIVLLLRSLQQERMEEERNTELASQAKIVVGDGRWLLSLLIRSKLNVDCGSEEWNYVYR